MRPRSTSDSTPAEACTPPNSEELIRRCMYDLYQQRGRADGHDVDGWLQAEAELTARSKAVAA